MRYTFLRNAWVLASTIVLAGSLAARAGAQTNCTNVAQTGLASAQSAYPGYSAARVNDGSRDTAVGGTTSWANAHLSGPDGVLPQWLDVVFARPSRIDRVDLYTSTGYPIRDYDIQIPAGLGAWVTVAGVRANTATLITTPLTPMTTDRLRIRSLSGPTHQPSYARINELEINGCDVGGAGRILGIVRDPAGRPIPGITVTAGGQTSVTDANGRYDITGLGLGTYTVRPSGGGYTFGSPAFQNANFVVTVSTPAPTATLNIDGYNRNPIVYVHGWNGGPGNFHLYPETLRGAGYRPYLVNLETSLAWTPPFIVNARRVDDMVELAKYETGQSQVILMSHSMGGLVSRAYLESSLYSSDEVSQYFSFGAPHLGTPAILHLGCLPNQPAVCQMTAPGMLLFNLTHWKRRAVDYHEIGGDAPMWTVRQLCWRIFGRRICINLPWPDTRFRNAAGWAMGALIGGPDDGFIGTCSAIGQPGTGIDRFVTQEVHTEGLGHRSYFEWDGNISQQSFGQCVEPLLANRSRTTCGVRGLLAWGCVLSAGQVPKALSRAAVVEAAPPASETGPVVVVPRSAPQTGRLQAGQTVTRDVIVEGGDVVFAASVEAGSASLSLVDPNGQVIDPAYVASITVDPSEPGTEMVDTVPHEAVDYQSEGGHAEYYFPNALPGTWRVILTGNPDIPAGGAAFATEATFASGFTATFRAEPFWTPGATTSVSVQLPSTATGTQAAMTLTLADGTSLPLSPLASGGTYTAAFAVPNVSGYAQVYWSVRGTRADGVAFERGGREDAQITAIGLTWAGVVSESTVPRSDPALFEALVLRARINSELAGNVQVTADLVNAAGSVVARANPLLVAAVGTNDVSLTFSGDDIYASGFDGPYTLANITLVDMRSAPLLGARTTDSRATAAYRATQFARQRGLPTVTTTGPYTVRSGATIAFQATGADPDGEALTFAWDLDNDGTFETIGASVGYTGPAVTAPFTQTLRVRASDASGNAAIAETSVDVLPAELNLSLTSKATASSTFAGYSPERVKDGNTATTLGGAYSWANNGELVCDTVGCHWRGFLPAWVELDLGTARTITRVRLFTSEGYVIRDYDLEAWDGESWVVLERVRGNTALVREHSFASARGSRLRLTGYSGPTNQPIYVRVNELEVYGY